MVDEPIAFGLSYLFLELFYVLFPFEKFLLQSDEFVLELSLLLQLTLGHFLQLLISLADLLQKRDVLITQLRQLLFDSLQLLGKGVVLGLILPTLPALLVPVVQNLEGGEIGLLEILVLVGLELDERVNVGLDLRHHEVELLDVLHRPLVLTLPIFLPDALEQLEVVGLVGHHLLLLVRLLLTLEPDQRELAVQIVLLLEQTVHLPEEEFLAEGPAVGLELSGLVELVAEVRTVGRYLGVLLPVLLQQLGDVLLQLAQLDVGQVAVREQDRTLRLRLHLGSALCVLWDHLY